MLFILYDARILIGMVSVYMVVYVVFLLFLGFRTPSKGKNETRKDHIVFRVFVCQDNLFGDIKYLKSL